MKRNALPATGLALSLLLLTAVAPVEGQTGLGLKGHLVYNESTVRTFQDDRDHVSASDFVAFNVGAELMLPLGLGLGVAGQASGDPRDTNAGTVFVILGEVNYFYSIPVIPVQAFVGMHAGLGTLSWDTRDEVPGSEIGELSRADLGWQAGIRLKLMPRLAVEAMYRSLGASAKDDQNPGFESNQFLLGLRFF